VRLGWSHGDQEIFSTEEMVAAFDLPHIGRSPARFDFAKLESVNGHYIRQTSDADLVDAIERLLPHLANGAELGAKFTAGLKAKFRAAMPGLKERAKNLVELIDNARFLYAQRPIAIDEKAKALLGAQARAIIAELLPDLSKVEPWTAPTIEDAVRTFIQRKAIKLGAVAQPSRVALTGRPTSPGIFDVLQVLGREESLARLGDHTG
jgi:glutamyl-tRNA synthetase